MSYSQFTYEDSSYNTRSPEKLVPIFLEIFKPSSVIDVGCGIGTWLSVFQKEGISDFIGIDGKHITKENIIIPYEKFIPVNLEQPFNIKRKFDLCICLEVAEHLEEKTSSNFIKCLTESSDIIVFSAAVPMQGGDMHINEQEPGYWRNKFSENGFRTYDLIRKRIWAQNEIKWWYRQNIFVASKNPINGLPTEEIPFIIHPELFFQKVQQIEVLQNITLKDIPRLVGKAIRNSFQGKKGN